MSDEKVRVVRQAQKKFGAVAMVVDWINDTPAPVAADVRIVIGSGTDIAIDVGDIILVRGDLPGLVSAIKLSIAELCMAFSSVSVVTNGSLLRRASIRPSMNSK